MLQLILLTYLVVVVAVEVAEVTVKHNDFSFQIRCIASVHGKRESQ